MLGLWLGSRGLREGFYRTVSRLTFSVGVRGFGDMARGGWLLFVDCYHLCARMFVRVFG